MGSMDGNYCKKQKVDTIMVVAKKRLLNIMLKTEKQEYVCVCGGDGEMGVGQGG